MRLLTRIAAFPLAALIMSAAPAPKYIPLDNYGEALVIPAGSPVALLRFNKRDAAASFRGRFVLTGMFVYGCDIECEPPLAKGDVHGSIIPDSDTAARLPHWKIRNNDMRIYLYGGDRLAAQVVTPDERAAIFAGKVDSIRKHVSIVVDDFKASIECDSASYDARFISLAKPPTVAAAKLGGDYGCGWI
jgi:hypothetical protein